jgi:hypothetical protein
MSCSITVDVKKIIDPPPPPPPFGIVYDDSDCNGRAWPINDMYDMSFEGRANSGYKSTKGDFKDYSSMQDWTPDTVASVRMMQG